MIKIDFQKFMYDHVWFGWWYHPAYNERDGFRLGRWVRDPHSRLRWFVLKWRDAIEAAEAVDDQD
jgi:hypothetical protein